LIEKVKAVRGNEHLIQKWYWEHECNSREEFLNRGKAAIDGFRAFEKTGRYEDACKAVFESIGEPRETEYREASESKNLFEKMEAVDLMKAWILRTMGLSEAGIFFMVKQQWDKD